MTDPIDGREVRADNREVRADGREVRADGREGRADNRNDQADEREGSAVRREKSAVGRDQRATSRDDKIAKSVRYLIIMCFVLIVIATASIIRSFVVQDAVEKIEVIENEQTRKQAETLAELREAVNRSNSGGAETAEAVAAIHRMEGYLCGGPCPPPPPE